MATVVWIGNAKNTAQKITLTITAVLTGGTLTVTINGKSITYTVVAADTTTTAATNWLALLNDADAPPEFAEIDWSSSAAVITGEAAVPGTPFTITKDQNGGATVTLATSVVNTSQSDVNDANNWLRNLSAGLPVNGDDMVLANSNVPLLWNLGSLSGILLNSFKRYQSFTASVGLPENNPLGYVEYRPTYLKLASNVATFSLMLGEGSGNGPTRERYDMQSYKTLLTVLASGQPTDAYAVRFLGSHGENAVRINNTSVGIAMLPSEATPNGATLNTATVDGGGTLDCGAGCAFSGTAGGGTLTVTGGTVTLFNTPTIVARNGATVTLAAVDGTYASITANNGVRLNIAAPMTITVLTLQKSSNMDLSRFVGAVTVTTSTMDGDTCQVNDPNNNVTWTNATTVNGQVTTGCITFTGQRTLRII